MAKAPTKTTTKRAAAPAAKSATTTTRTPGSTPARDAANLAASQANAAYDAKANALAKAGEKSSEKPKRFVVAEGRSVRSGGVRFTQGEAIDLSAADAERLQNSGHVVEDDGGELADGGDQADQVAGMAPGDAAPPGTPPSETDNIGDTPAGDK